jgi:pyrimidine deaminase RibD-like protein
MTDQDRECIRKAIDASKNSPAEAGKPTPKVGAVVAKDGATLAVTWRGQEAPGDHAEFGALEKKLGEVVIAGATVYTTLSHALRAATQRCRAHTD